MRTAWVDGAKAAGISFVVFNHVNRGIYLAGLPFAGSQRDLINSVVSSFVNLLFFFLSGLFFQSSLDAHGPVSTIRSKAKSLLYPYIVWSLLQGTMEIFLGSVTNGKTNFTEVFSLLWQPRAQFWFLHALFITVSIAAFLYWVTPKRFQFVIPIAAAFIYLFKSQTFLPKIVFVQASVFVYFALGVYAKRIIFSFNRPTVAIAFLAVITTAIAQASFLSLGGLTECPPIIQLMTGIVSILTIIVVAMYFNNFTASRFVQYVGKNSMVIYLSHVLFTAGARIALMRIFHVQNVLIHFVIGCAAGLLLPLVLEFASRRLGATWLFEAPTFKAFHKSPAST